MTRSVQHLQVTETQFMDNLRDRYEKEGFNFVTHPERNKLPEFLGEYIPDAIAQKPGRNVVIEVKGRPNPMAERSIREIRRLFDGHPDWQFQVFFMSADPLQSVKIPIAG